MRHRDGQHDGGDVGAPSSFVADAPNVVGFASIASLADHPEARAA